MAEGNLAEQSAQESSANWVTVDSEPAAPAADPTLMSRWDAARGEIRAGTTQPPRERPELEAGQVIGGRYRLERRVGAGGRSDRCS